MTPEEYINKVKKNLWHAVSGGWLGTFVTEENALAAVELARKEVLKRLVSMLDTSIDNKHFFEQLGDYIDELMDELRKE